MGAVQRSISVPWENPVVCAGPGLCRPGSGSPLDVGKLTTVTSESTSSLAAATVVDRTTSKTQGKDAH